MENSLVAALARQSVMTRQMEVIATNLANLNTVGFKAETLLFTEHLARTADHQEALSLVHDVSITRNLAEGPITKTGNPLDLAIRGSGYFPVQTPDGPRYTRDGTFQLDDSGQIVTAEGYPVLGAGGAPITVPPEAGSIAFARDGTLSGNDGPIDRLQVIRFENEQALTKLGGNLYDAGDQAPRPTPDAEIVPGAVEGANVSGVSEITRMIDTVRGYQAAARMAESEHQRILDAIEALAVTT